MVSPMHTAIRACIPSSESPAHLHRRSLSAAAPCCLERRDWTAGCLSTRLARSPSTLHGSGLMRHLQPITLVQSASHRLGWHGLRPSAKRQAAPCSAVAHFLRNPEREKKKGRKKTKPKLTLVCLAETTRSQDCPVWLGLPLRAHEHTNTKRTGHTTLTRSPLNRCHPTPPILLPTAAALLLRLCSCWCSFFFFFFFLECCSPVSQCSLTLCLHDTFAAATHAAGVTTSLSLSRCSRFDIPQPVEKKSRCCS